MRKQGTPLELEKLRTLAVRRVREGYSAADVADFLEVDASSVRRWVRTFDQRGWDGLLAQPQLGRPRKLSPTQENILLRWLREPATEHGFPTELWTSRRLAQLIGEEWGIGFHPRYLPAWLRHRRLTPQKPQRVPRERNPQAIAAWLASDWPRIKKKRDDKARTSF
jgi:transposase